MSQPSRWDKDRRFEKRCREEGIRVRSKNPPQPETQTMTFGKYEGVPITNVNTKYLKWLAKNLDFVPDYVIDELFNRRELKRLPRKTQARAKNNSRKKTTCKSSGSVTVGKDYEAIREQWELAGGDASQCPFGDEYTGPYLCWEGSEPVIICTSMEVRHED